MSNANVFVWYSKSSEDSGKALAGLVGTTQHGTLPPKDFKGVLICYGAIPGEKFKWADRDIRFIFNDPRHTRKYVDRAAMFDELSKAGLSVPKLYKILPNSTFDQACAAVGVNPVVGVSVFKSSGSEARAVHNEAGFRAAMTAGAVYASSIDFLSEKRTRFFIVNGTFVGATSRSNGNHAVFSKLAANEQTVELDKTKAENLIKFLLENGIVDAAKTYWQSVNAVDPRMTEVAVKVAKTLGLDFCAVDLTTNATGQISVLNTVSTPDIVSPAMRTMHGALSDSLKLWLKRSFKTAREIIADLAAEATEEEAEAIVSELRKMKSAG